ncbi:hypothetical protein SAY87_018547 [Trapa incisa]|uniref:Autophagy-related protein 27 n=1 Tax=Trapa incisa TaxID=236973 RepID=A0AAN7LB03_9MYRT|nr:hypothetical protein SAY87_018547 [Trapa incisa]
MKIRCGSNQRLFLILLSITLLRSVLLRSATAVCDLSVFDSKKLYSYSLASPIPKFPHGVLSEDGFYRVEVNKSVLWFQLCNRMIFNHGPPKCVDCTDCGGPSNCGMQCSALVASDVGGYPVCSTVGHLSSSNISIADETNPHSGVIVKMFSINQNVDDKVVNCSLSVTVLCDYTGAQGPHTLKKSGACDYDTLLKHPSGCANVVYIHGRGWGWFGTFLIIMLSLLAGYLLAGAVYRYFVLRIHSIDAIPNLEFWASLPHRTQSSLASLVRKFRGPSEGYRSSYSPVNF